MWDNNINHNDTILIQDEANAQMQYQSTCHNQPATPDVGAQNQPQSPGWWTSTRFRIALLFMGGAAIGSLMQSNLGVAMACMVNSTTVRPSVKYLNQSNSTDQSESTCSKSNYDTILNDYGGAFDWDSTQQGFIFSAIWWSGLVTIFPGGIIADRYGPKNTLSAVALITIALTALIPKMARLGYRYLLAIRFLTGFGQGMVTPILTAAISTWIPPVDRSLTLAIMTTGNQLPSVLGNPLFGWLCTQKQLLGGWPMIFYLCSLITLIWLTIWIFFMSNRPENHQHISKQEVDYIEHTLRNQNIIKNNSTVEVPWLQLIKSRVIWALMIMGFATSFANLTFASYIPTYFKEVLYFDIKKNGVLSALPSIAQFIGKFFWTFLARQLSSRTTVSKTRSCAIFNTIGCFGQSIFLVSLSFLNCTHSGLAVFLLCSAQFMTAAVIPGYVMAFLSIAPRYTGTVRSCGAMMTQIGGLTAPYLVGGITKNGTRFEWQIVFLIMAAILITSNLVWICFGSAQIQPWAMATTMQQEDNNKNG